MRVNLIKGLGRWQAAGLIDAETAEAIRGHEQAIHRPFLANAAYLLGGFAMLLGIVALVAANWDAIPASFKLSAHFAVNLAVGAALFVAAARGRAMASEVLTLISFGLVLTLIALIGQVYQLQSPLWAGLCLWMLLASPLVLLFARSRFVLCIWLAALTVTLATTSEPLFDSFERFPLTASQPSSWLVALYGAIPLLFIAMAGAGYPAKEGATLPPLLLAYGLATLLWSASVAQMGWYGDSANLLDDFGPMPVRLAVCLWLAVMAAAVLAWMRTRLSPEGFRALAVLAAACILLGSVPFIFLHLESRPASAALFIVLWAIAGWAGVTSGWVWAGRIAVAVIMLRLLIVYFELFGSLARTGVGLLFSGLVVIALTYAGVRLQKRLMGLKVAS